MIEKLKRLARRLLVDPIEPVISKLLRFPRIKTGIPEGQRIYVIGDIHGRVDLLREVHAKIERDKLQGPEPEANTIVYLGDYVDGGPSTRDVLDILIEDTPAGARAVTLLGNHDNMLLEFLENSATGNKWLKLFGRATLENYGVSAPEGQLSADQLASLREAFFSAFPTRHLTFLRSLQTIHIVGDYAFVHAGIRPGVCLADQSIEDLIWIRKPFISSALAHEKVIVHGHTYSRKPRVRAHRIGIDTGSYFTGRLTCLVLEGRSFRFL